MEKHSNQIQLSAHQSASREAWVDVVKGLSIILVVMMHSTLGVQIAAGDTSWMGSLVEFARPFRIPCFMLVSGLFLHRSIKGDWNRYLDRKILHFVYFYVLWVNIQILIKAPAWWAEGQSAASIFTTYLMTYVQPFGTLWFIYLLPVFYLVTRLLKDASWKWVLGGAIILQVLPIHTGWVLVDEFASRYVYFLIGFYFYASFFKWSEFVLSNVKSITLLLFGWAGLNLLLINGMVPEIFNKMVSVSGADPVAKLADLPFVSLGLGLAGTLALISIGNLILKSDRLSFMRWVGEHSIVIYLAFFLPMAVSRIAILKFSGDVISTGWVALIVTMIAVIGPIVFYLIIRRIGIGKFLFERPRFARIKNSQSHQTASMQNLNQV